MATFFFIPTLNFLSLFLSFLISQGIEAKTIKRDCSFIGGPDVYGRVQRYKAF